MQDDRVQVPVQEGPSRRTVIKAGAVAGSVVWTAPVVQALGVRSADAASGGETVPPPPPPPPAPTCHAANGQAQATSAVVLATGTFSSLNLLTDQQSASSLTKGAGGPNRGQGGLSTLTAGPITTTNLATLALTTVTAGDDATSFGDWIADGGADATASTFALKIPGVIEINAEKLLSKVTASAKPTLAGQTGTATATTTVQKLTYKVLTQLSGTVEVLATAPNPTVLLNGAVVIERDIRKPEPLEARSEAIALRITVDTSKLNLPTVPPAKGSIVLARSFVDCDFPCPKPQP